MVRVYTRKTTRGDYGQGNLANALAAIQNGQALKAAARDFSVPPKTLRRHRDGNVRMPGSISTNFFNKFSTNFLTIYMRMTSHGQCPRGGGVLVNVQEWVYFSICWRADDVTRTMSKGGGGVCECLDPPFRKSCIRACKDPPPNKNSYIRHCWGNGGTKTNKNL